MEGNDCQSLWTWIRMLNPSLVTDSDVYDAASQIQTHADPAPRAQNSKLLNSLSWEDVATGTNPFTTWTSVVKMLGSGSGGRKKQARNAAARQALIAMGVVDNLPPDE
ncbi:hypothetical protein FRC00_003590 [Tulasnella sp. 408]|nr:hypothetical protein FRC00_003590 [Tulasnella sp. 408]